MSIKIEGLVAMDMDGTILHPTEPKQRYFDAAVNEFSQQTGLPINNELIERLQVKENIVKSDPEKYGWKINGITVCPAADYILVTHSAMELLFEELRGENTRVLKLPEKENESEILHRIYKTGYEVSHRGKTVFRKGTEIFVKNLAKQNRLAIVTNSSPDNANKVVAELSGDAYNIPVYPNARKHHIDPERKLIWKGQEIPVTFQLEGLYPEHLRRPDIFAILDRLKPEATIGDIHVLDNLLACYMGMYTALATSELTPKKEIEHYKKSENKVAFSSFDEIADTFL